MMESPAAYTLPVKLLTSTNYFLMIGPMSHKTVIPHKQSYSDTLCTLHAFTPTHIHNEFYQGKCLLCHGSLQMSFLHRMSFLKLNVPLTLSPICGNMDPPKQLQLCC